MFGRPKKVAQQQEPTTPTPTINAQVTQKTKQPEISPELHDALNELSTKYGGTFNPGDLSPICDLLIATYAEQRKTNQLLQTLINQTQ